MGGLPEPISNLVSVLSKLPGIGLRSAERIALFLVQADRELTSNLANVLTQAREKISFCSNCGGLTEIVPCSICANHNRDSAILCLVERPLDVFTIEKSGAFKGRYHVLGGRISP